MQYSKFATEGSAAYFVNLFLQFFHEPAAGTTIACLCYAFCVSLAFGFWVCGLWVVGCGLWVVVCSLWFVVYE